MTVKLYRTRPVHELSIALNILDIAAEEAERRGGAVVRAVHVRIGPLSGVVNEALASAYELAREQSSLSASRLVIEETPIVVYCETCRAECPAESLQSIRCSRCGTLSGKLIGGDELEVTALELEEPPAASKP